MNRPNKELTDEEKQEKRALKRQLKYQARLYKLETRLRQSKIRSDRRVEIQTRYDLDKLFQNAKMERIVLQPTIVVLNGDNNNNNSKDNNNDDCWDPGEEGIGVCSYDGEKSARRLVESIYGQLRRQLEADVVRSSAAEELSNPNGTTNHDNNSDDSRDSRNNQQEHSLDDGSKRIMGKQESSSKIRPKEFCTQQARTLCRNMTKGTQTVSMFRNRAALLGYTQQKFIERAMLIVHSLGKLVIDVDEHGDRHTDDAAISTITSNNHKTKTVVANNESIHETVMNDDDDGHKRMFFQRLKEVRKICSIGCGPGCDLVGILCFLHSIHHEKFCMSGSKDADAARAAASNVNESSSSLFHLDEAVLLDWTIDQWKVVLDPLQQLLLRPDDFKKRPVSVNTIQTAKCDVRVSMFDPVNHSVQRQVIMSSSCDDESQERSDSEDVIPDTSDMKCSDATITPRNNQDPTSRLWKTDLVIASYLLSETRGQWYAFFDDIVRAAAPRTLFLFTDPTAWQMHLLLQRCCCPDDRRATGKDTAANDYNDCSLDYIWLDSSIDRPDLQLLEGRVGPAVLLAMKK